MTWDRGSERQGEALQGMKKRLLALLPGPAKIATKVPGVSISRRDRTSKPENCFYEPIAGLVIQGHKRSCIGADEYMYGGGDCLVAGVDVPSITHVTHATPEEPFLAISLKLDAYAISQLAAEIPAAHAVGPSHKAVAVAPADPELLDAFTRLMDLVEKPDQARILGPMVLREIHYRLLTGPWGGLLRSLNTLGTQSNQISRAIAWLRENYKQPFQIEDLAKRVNMAPSTFHRHFRQVTSLSPLQFQKRLRLYEAERLMLTSGKDAGGAALEVGYESPNQFNREYKRLFGEPPHRDINRKRSQEHAPSATL